MGWFKGKTPRPYNPKYDCTLFPDESTEGFRALKEYLPATPSGFEHWDNLHTRWMRVGWLTFRDDEGHPCISRSDCQWIVWYQGEIWLIEPGELLGDAMALGRCVSNLSRHSTPPPSEPEFPRFGDGSYYDILGIEEDATPAEIKRAYLDLVRTMHPDRGGPAAIFRQIQMTYESLSDPERRADYDRMLKYVRI